MFTKTWLVDTSERFLSTFGETFLGVLVLSGADVVHMSTLKAALVAGLASGLAFLKGVVAAPVGTRGTAGLVRLRTRRPRREPPAPAPRKAAPPRRG